MHRDRNLLRSFVSGRDAALRRTVVAVIVGSAVAAAGAAFAQATPPAVTPEAEALAPVTFTSQQVSTGRGLFGGACAGCHGEALEGLDGGPTLVGDSFAHWYTGPVSALYDFVLTRMPLDAPGTLQPRQALGLVAFLLERNGFVAGDVPLPDDPAAMELLGFRQ